MLVVMQSGAGVKGLLYGVPIETYSYSSGLQTSHEIFK